MACGLSMVDKGSRRRGSEVGKGTGGCEYSIVRTSIRLIDSDSKVTIVAKSRSRYARLERRGRRTAFCLCADMSPLPPAVHAEMRRDRFLQPPPTEFTCARVVHLRAVHEAQPRQSRYEFRDELQDEVLMQLRA